MHLHRRRVLGATAMLILLGMRPARSQQTTGRLRGPIIDVHAHTYRNWHPKALEDSAWYPADLPRARSEDELIRSSLAEFRRLGVVLAFVGGDPESLKHWRAADVGRVAPALEFGDVPDDPKPLLDSIRAWHRAGEVKMLGEVQLQYLGYSPSDSVFEPYLALAEELDLPVGIHMGLGPPARAQRAPRAYRSRLSSPLNLEEALVRHPKARVYVMHAGWPMLDDMVAMLYAFPNLYVDTGVIDWYISGKEFHSYLKRLVDAGYGKRIMFGSDQMDWPGSIARAVDGIESATFLTPEQKRDIFFNNAVRFFRLDAKALVSR